MQKHVSAEAERSKAADSARRWARLGAMLLGAVLGVSALGGGAWAGSSSCSMVPVTPTEIPCSFQIMRKAVDTRFVMGEIKDPADYYARRPGPAGLYEHAPPGQAHLQFSGLLNIGGGACVQHVARSMVGAIGSGMQAGGKFLGHMGFAPGVTNKQNLAKLKALGAKMNKDKNDKQAKHKDLQQAAKMLFGGPHAPANGQNPNKEQVVFAIFSPNLFTAEYGDIPAEGGLPAPARSVGGWGPRGLGYLVITLPGVHPSELRAGKTYPAKAVAASSPQAGSNIVPTLTEFYGSARGRLAVSTHPVDPYTRNACKQMPSINKIAMGRDVCSGKTIAFEGVTRMVGGSLSGKVTIQRVSDSQVVGKFHLAGQGTMVVRRFKFTHDSKTGQIDGSRMVDKHASSGPLQASGRFRAPNVRGYGPIPAPDPTVLMAAHIPPSGGKAGKKKLHLVASLPANDEYNVNWEANLQQIHLTFDQPVDVSTFNKNDAYLEWDDASDQAQRIPLQVSGNGPDGKTIVLSHPGVDLKDGVRYRVHLLSGSRGIRGQRGEPLAADYQWDFYTMLDFKHRDRTIPGLEKILTPKEGIEAHVFQVARDAKLVLHKPTLTRVYVKWWKRKDVAKDWQATKFPATVVVHAESKKGPLLYRGQDVWIRRPDKYGDTSPRATTAKRFARNSVNFFNWRPGQGVTAKPSKIVVEVDPKIHCETVAKEFYSEPKGLAYTDLQVTPTVAYYFVRFGLWEKGVPAKAKALGRAAAAGFMRFAAQNFPIQGLRIRPGGEIGVAPWARLRLKVKLAVILPYIPKKRKPVVRHRITENFLAQYVEDEVASLGDSDLIVVFTPLSKYLSPAQTFQHHWFCTKPGHKDCGPHTALKLPIPIIQVTDKAITPRLGAVSHELGHVFGLHHHPPTPGKKAARIRKLVCGPGYLKRSSSAGKIVGGSEGKIEGFRIALSGLTGSNKSVVEGNADNPKGLLPLMFPCEGTSSHDLFNDKSDVFVRNASYSKLITDIEEYKRAGKLASNRAPGSSIMLAANDVPAGAQPNGAVAPFGLAERGHEVAAVTKQAVLAAGPGPEYLYVRGDVKSDGTAGIQWVHEIEAPFNTDGESGAWKLEAVGAHGSVLGSRRLDIELPQTGSVPIRAVVSAPGVVSEVRLYHGGTLVTALKRTPHMPSATIKGIRPVSGGKVRVHWTSDDPDGGKLMHALLYAPSRQGPWTVVRGWTAGSSATIDKAVLSPGASPTIKLMVSDGFNASATTSPVSDLVRLRVITEGPVTGLPSGGEQTQRPDVYALFNADLAPGAVSGKTFLLNGSSGRHVPAKAEYLNADRMAVLVPDKPLTPGVRYTATLSGSIADRYGDTLGKAVSWQFVQQAPPGATARAAASAASPAEGPAGGATPAAGAQTRNPLNGSGAGGASGGGSGWSEPVGGTRANPPGTTPEVSAQKGSGTPQPAHAAGVGAQGNGATPPGAAMPDLNAPGYSASGAAQEAGGPAGSGAGETLKGGHGHLKFDKLERDFAIDSCHFQSAPGGELVVVSVQQPGLQLHITASPMAPGIQIQQVSVVLGAASTGITYTADRMEQGGSWHDEAGHGASGPLIRIQGHRVSVAGTFSETGVNVQRNVAGTIEADCGG